MKTKKIYKIGLLILPMVLGVTMYCLAQEELKEGTSFAKELKKSIRVMEKVFDHVMKKEFEGDYVSEGFFSQGSQGYWLPDHGVLFTLNVKFPLSVQKPTMEPKQKAPKDLWEKYEQQVEGNDPVGGSPSYSEDFDDINQHKIDRLKNTIIETLAKYGERVSPNKEWSQQLFVIVENRPEGGFEMPTIPMMGQIQPMPQRIESVQKPERPDRIVEESENRVDDNAIEQAKEEIKAAQEEIQQVKELIEQQKSAIKDQAKAMDQQEEEIKKQIDEEAKRAREMARQVQQQVAGAIGMAQDFLEENPEFKKFLPEGTNWQDMVPSQDQIEKFIPSQKEWKKFEKHLKWFPFFGEDYPQRQRTTMVFRVSFKDIHLLKDKPDMFQEKVRIEIY